MIKSKRVKKLVVSLLLAISLLSCSFSVYADDPLPTPTVNPLMEANDGTVAFLTWQILDSWGIKVQFGNIYEFTTDVQNQIQEWIWEYLDNQPSPLTVAAWTLDWLWGTDFWGHLVGNNSMLDDLQDFADWLTRKFNLTDNSTVHVTQPGYNMGGYILYNTPVAIPNNHGDIKFYVEPGNSNSYVFFVRNSRRPSLSWFVLSLEEGDYYTIKELTNNNTYLSTDVDITFHNDNSTIYYEKLGHNEAIGNDPDMVNLSQFEVYDAESTVGLTQTGFTKNITTFFDEFNTITYENKSISILTRTINLPDSDPDYSPGDSITIVDNEPDYSIVDWDGSVNVSNLPSIISTGTIDNPELDQIYTNIPPLIEEAGSSMEIFRQIIFRMPDGVLIALYALLSAGVIFGMLRIMREH